MNRLYFCFSYFASIFLVTCLLNVATAFEGSAETDAEELLPSTDVIEELPATESSPSEISERSFEWYPFALQQIALAEYGAAFGYTGGNVHRLSCSTPSGQTGECRPRQRCSRAPSNGHFCYLNNGYPGVCCVEDKTALSPSPQNYAANKQPSKASDYSKCGDYVKELYRIQGGNEADEGEWPWMAALLRDGTDQFCGGVLVSDRHILTVAHCVHELGPDEIKVRLGEYDFSKSNDNRVDYSVSKIVVHENFNRRTYVNDIAVLKLKRRVEFNKRIRPICLPSGNVAVEGRSAYVTGWGTTSYAGVSSDVLREALLPIWRQSECRAALTSWTFTDSQICAGYKPGARDSCQGDSGGPLMLEETSVGWAVVGLVSWGLRCGLPNQPGVYTRVTSYLPWIKNKMLI